MSWATISAAQFVAEGFNASERTAVTLAAGGDDGLTSIIASAVGEWRGVIDASGNTVDTVASTVPASTRRHVISQCRWQLLIKFPSLKALQTDARKAAADRADEVLEMIAKGTMPVEAPVADTTLTGGSSGGQTRIAMRTDDQDSYDP